MLSVDRRIDAIYGPRGMTKAVGLPMDNEYWKHVPRHPRHQAVDAAQLQVEVERAGGKTRPAVQAELLDLSRDGIRLRVALPLMVRESITVRLRAEGSAVNVALPCTVRWRRPENDGTWSIGCESARQVDWETLGELFFSGVLATEPPSSQASDEQRA